MLSAARRGLLVAVAAGLLGFAPAPFPKERRGGKDRADVIGTWEVVRWQQKGRRESAADRNLVLEITGDRVAFHERGSGKPDVMGMRLYRTAQPAGFTWNDEGRVVVVGSYRLSGGQLTMILAEGKRLDDRPTDFAAEAQVRIVLRRISRPSGAASAADETKGR